MTMFERFRKTYTRHETTVDTRTGLEWQAVPFPGGMTWDEAEKACRNLRLGGHDDWRLPTLEELESIRDLTRYSPCIDPEAFPDCPSEWFWTRTPYAPSPSDFAWVVSFSGGYSYVGIRDGSYRVRAVRVASSQFSDSLKVA